MTRAAMVVLLLAGCGGQTAPAPVPPKPAPPAQLEARLPRVPGELAPSLVTIDRSVSAQPGDVSDGTQLADVDGCSTCHADAAAQWSKSAHSFASFGNPIYRVNVELSRTELGKKASNHCGGCHD